MCEFYTAENAKLEFWQKARAYSLHKKMIDAKTGMNLKILATTKTNFAFLPHKAMSLRQRYYHPLPYQAKRKCYESKFSSILVI